MTQRLADAETVNVLVAKLALQISRHNQGVSDLALVGIKRRGVPLAQRIARRLSSGRKPKVQVGAIDITLYRDDLQMVAETAGRSWAPQWLDAWSGSETCPCGARGRRIFRREPTALRGRRPDAGRQCRLVG